MGLENVVVGPKKLPDLTARPGAGLGLAWPARNQKRPAWARPGARPRLAKLQEHAQHENEHILIIQTPFLMFLGSLEPQQKALQEYT